MGVGGAGGAPRGPREPSHSYYAALIAILSLLLMLCLYFFYYFIRKVNELRQVESLTPTTAVRAPSRPPPAAATATYPVQPVVRDSASAMAMLCKQLPCQPAGKGGTVFPASTSPAAQQTDTGRGEAPPAPDKVPAPAAPVLTTVETDAR